MRTKFNNSVKGGLGHGQDPAEGTTQVSWVWTDQPVFQALVIPFSLVVLDEVLNRRPQRMFSKQDRPLQTAFLDAAGKPLGVSVQVRTAWWQ
jgi:hypothetical protein